MNSTSTSAHVHSGNIDDRRYDRFLGELDRKFQDVAASNPLFTTDAEGLWDLYLGAFADPAERQYHNCNECRRFIERYGALVTIDENGKTTPAVWDDKLIRSKVAGFPYTAMADRVRKAKVTGVFLSNERVLGQPRTGVWRHLAVAVPVAVRYKGVVKNADQAMAEKREDYRIVSEALGSFSLPNVEQALRLLESDSLYRAEKVIGPATFLKQLHEARSGKRGAARNNVVWRMVATAPTGFCHPRSGMIGTLLEDIASGLSFDSVSKRFREKMHPLQYQRPQAAPKEGTITQAIKVVDALDAAGALQRRFCRVDEVEALWRPRPEKVQPTGGIFDHLRQDRQRSKNIMPLPQKTMTWTKFQSTVLPTAERIQIKAPSHGSYSAFCTAVHADAPPILQWDRDECRNPVSWYFWFGGSTAHQFGLIGDQYYDVPAITYKPSMWNGSGLEHHGNGVMFVIEGARDSRRNGAHIFPETLRSEFHPIRSVIEAYAKRGVIQDTAGQLAAGIMQTSGDTPWHVELRVWTNGQSADYRLDRWD